MNNLENIFTDNKEKSTQYVEEVDISTQTDDKRITPSTTLTTSMAMLTNRLLNSSYWFLSLGLVFSSHSLPTLRNNCMWRQSITRDSAKRIISLLMPMDSQLLVDVARPSLVVTECTVVQAVGDIRDLDKWLLDSLREVVMVAREEGGKIVLEVLEQIMEEQKILLEESSEMNSSNFIHM